MQFSKLLLMATLFTVAALTSCNKNDENEDVITESEEFNSRDYAYAQSLYTASWELVVSQAQEEPALNGLADHNGSDNRNNCPAVTLNSGQGVYPKTMILDFASGCTLPNGATASGQITAVFTGPVDSVGTTISITFDAFVYSGYGVNGTYSCTVSSPATFTVNVGDGLVSTPQGKTVSYSGSIVCKQVAGLGTSDNTDDVFTIAADLSGTDTYGKSFTAKTSSDLRKEVTCEWIVSGIVEVKSGNGPKKTVDFGSGTCDDQATLKIGLSTKTITLP